MQVFALFYEPEDDEGYIISVHETQVGAQTVAGDDAVNNESWAPLVWETFSPTKVTATGELNETYSIFELELLP